MIQPGTSRKTRRKHRIRVEEFLGSGGQGTTYRAMDLDTRTRCVLKLFHAQFTGKDSAVRTDFLCGQNLSSASPLLASPMDMVTAKSELGHVSPYVDGTPLSQLIESGSLSFHDALFVAIACSHAVHVLHSRGIVHGDIRDENVLVSTKSGLPAIHFIDLDNFRASGVPKPFCIGHELYMAPELAEARNRGVNAYPDVYTDRFSLTTLQHEILLFKHPASGRDTSPQGFADAMYSGKWIHDPASPPVLPDPGGYSAHVLSNDVATLFRRGLSRVPDERPTALEWRTALLQALPAVFLCPFCRGPSLVDASKQECPLCFKPYPTLTLATRTGRRININRGCIRIGRHEIGGSPRVSALHAVFRKIGPEVWLESKGRNHTYRNEGGAWVQLDESGPVLINAGDVLRFADTEVRII